MKQDKRSIKRFRCWLVESKQYVYDIQKICDGKLIKSFAEILNNPEKYVVEQETGAIDIAKNKIREGDIAKYRGIDFEGKNGGWVVGYNYHLEELVYADAGYVNYGEPVRYATEEDAKRSIKENRADWLAYFGIKEWE